MIVHDQSSGCAQSAQRDNLADRERTSVTIIGLHYAPEPTGNAPYTTRLAEGLSGIGHRVKVVCGYPHYPFWRLTEGYRGLSIHEVLGGVPIHRLRHTVPAKPTGLKRLLMELTFGFHVIMSRWGRPDVVLVVSPALFASAIAIVKARIAGIPVAIWVQDLYSRGMQETGASNRSTRMMKWIESRVLRACAAVVVVHERFEQYVSDTLNVPSDRIHVVRNWSHVLLSKELDRSAARDRLGWLVDEVIALHAGNMGVKQGLENVVEAARRADRSHSRVRFVLLGDGNRRDALVKAGQGIASLTYLSPLGEKEYAETLRAADVLVVNERPELREMSVPSKLTSYFASGLPIVAATHAESATADEIRASKAGEVVDPENPADLLQAVERLRTNPDVAASQGAAGLQYVADRLSERVAIREFSTLLSRISLGSR